MPFNVVNHSVGLGLSISALLVDIVLLVAAFFTKNLKGKTFKWFFYMALSITLAALFEVIVQALEGKPGESIFRLLTTLDYATYVCNNLGMFSFSMYVFEYFSLKTTLPKIYRKLFILFSALFGLAATVGTLTGSLSFFDEQNVYRAQDLLFLVYIPPVLLFFTYIVIIIKYFEYLTIKEISVFLMYTLTPVICYTLEYLFMDIWLAQIGASLTMLLVYVTLQVDMIQQLQKQETELAENQISIMLSQIKPHFLYNSLNAIDSLIYTDSTMAHEAVATFADYLRGNMDSLTQKNLIHFTTELKHIEQYLWLEQLRFGERLKIVYEVETEDFFLPVLTVQPIVENAVRYGVTKRDIGGTVTIKTEETPQNYRITVTDDGVGFDMNALAAPQPQLDGRSHLGIANVKSRLQVMCGGTLNIESTVGVGTTATIEIPKKEKP